MPLWNTVDTASDGARPKYANTDPHMNVNDVYATSSGWVHNKTYTDMHGNTRNKEEILVAIRGLAGESPVANTTLRLGKANIVDVRFDSATLAAGAVSNVIVTFNERVEIVGANVLTLSIGAANTTAAPIAGAANTLNATYVSGSGTNRLRFNFTADANAANYTVYTTSIANTAALALVDVESTSVAANLDIHSSMTGSNSAIGTVVAV